MYKQKRIISVLLIFIMLFTNLSLNNSFADAKYYLNQETGQQSAVNDKLEISVTPQVDVLHGYSDVATVTIKNISRDWLYNVNLQAIFLNLKLKLRTKEIQKLTMLKPVIYLEKG